MRKVGCCSPLCSRSALASGMVVTRGFEENLMLFPHHEWQVFAQKILNQPLSLAQSRALRRRMFSNAAVIEVDRRGRIQIPASLCEFAGLKRQVVLAGMFDYLEIWNPQEVAAGAESIERFWKQHDMGNGRGLVE